MTKISITGKNVVAMFAVFLLGCMYADAGQIIDRIVAKVNGHIILQSDWEDAVRCEAVMNDRAMDEISSAQRRDVLSRLVDQELLREQISQEENPSVSETDVLRRLDEIRRFYSTAGKTSSWSETLARYHVSEGKIKARIALQMQLLQLVDVHLRPRVQIDQKSVEAYYNHDLVPQMKKAGVPQIPFAKAAPQIREILTQQKMNQLLVAWLQNLRATSRIVTDSGDTGDGVR